MINPFFCLDCDKHILNHSTRSIDCKMHYILSCPIQSIRINNAITAITARIACDFSSANSYDKSYQLQIEELLRLEKEIKHVEKGIFNGKAYRKDQELIQRRNELNRRMTEDYRRKTEEANEKKKKEDYSKSETIEYLSRLNITRETVYNYQDANEYVFNSFYNGNVLDKDTICYAVQWNQSELLRRERLKQEAEKLEKAISDTKIRVCDIIELKCSSPKSFISYAYDIKPNCDYGFGSEYDLYGYGFVDIIINQEKPSCVVLVYSRTIDEFSEKALSLDSLKKKLSQVNSTVPVVLMNEKHTSAFSYEEIIGIHYYPVMGLVYLFGPASNKCASVLGSGLD